MRARAKNVLHWANDVAARMFKVKHLSLWVPNVKSLLKMQSTVEWKLVASNM